jgi:hypothetical protein
MRESLYSTNDDADEVGLQLPTRGNDAAIRNNDDDIQLIKELECSPSTLCSKRPHIVLSTEEKSFIRNDDMLTDESINLAQNRLSEQFPDLEGLENSTLGPLRGFSIFRGKYVQY